jgi:hypothetical protein
VVYPVRRGAAGTEGVLEMAMEAFDHPIGLWMVCWCLGVLDVQQVAQGGPQEVNWVPQSDVMTAGALYLLTHP